MPIKQLADDDSVLILWVIFTQAENAFKVVKSWGFEYVTGFPWIKTTKQPFVDMFGELVAKPVYGTGQWVRGCAELIYLCKRGNIPVPHTNFVGLLSERMEHSRKPNNIYEYADYFGGKKLELFARRQHPGWDVFGNEVEGSIDLRPSNTCVQRTAEERRR